MVLKIVLPTSYLYYFLKRIENLNKELRLNYCQNLFNIHKQPTTVCCKVLTICLVRPNPHSYLCFLFNYSYCEVLSLFSVCLSFYLQMLKV